MILSVAFCVTAFAAEVIDKEAPAGEWNFDFSIDLIIPGVSAPYAGAEFSVAFSDSNALTFNKPFVRSGAISSARISPEAVERKIHYFGFDSDSNNFQGNLNAGKVNFTYKGNAPQTITITRTVLRIVADKKVEMEKLDNIIINVSRKGGPGPGPGPGPSGGPTTIPDVPTPLAGKSFASFIEGFEDNTFRGNSQITREQFVTILSRLKNPQGAPIADVATQSFNDVRPGKWSYDAIEWAKTAGIIEANAAGNFRPSDPLTRAEMAVMLVKAEKLTEAAENIFNDLAGHKDAADILKAVKVNIFTGYEDGTFRPDGNSTRYEAVAALVRYLLGGEPADNMWQNIANKFTDVSKTHWAYKYVMLAVNGYTAVAK